MQWPDADLGVTRSKHCTAMLEDSRFDRMEKLMAVHRTIPLQHIRALISAAVVQIRHSCTTSMDELFEIAVGKRSKLTTDSEVDRSCFEHSSMVRAIVHGLDGAFAPRMHAKHYTSPSTSIAIGPRPRSLPGKRHLSST